MKICTAARFVTRGTGIDGEGAVDLILGAGMKGNNLKPNTVYEIMSIDGELTVREIGPSCRMNKRAWQCDANSILEEQFPGALLSQVEINDLQPPTDE